MSHRIRVTSRTVGVAAMLLGMSAVCLAATVEIDGKNGYEAARLFDHTDIQALSEWNLPYVWLGYTYEQIGEPRHGVGGTEDGKVYVLVHGGDADDPLTWVTGVVEYDANAPVPLRTVHQRTWSNAHPQIRALVVADLDPGVNNALVATGDVLLLETEIVSGAEIVRVLAFTPGSGAAPIELLSWEPVAAFGSDLELRGDGTLFIRALDLFRADYDAANVEYDAPTEVLTKSISDWDVGPDGYVYAYLEEHNKKGNPKKRIARVDPTQLNVYERKWAVPAGGWSQTRGFTFHTDGELYMGTYNPNKSPSGFFTKRNSKSKFPYSKRIAQWDAGPQDTYMHTIQSSPDGSFLCVARSVGWGSIIDESWSVWRISED